MVFIFTKHNCRMYGLPDTTLMAESEEELKSLLMKVKVESEKVGLKLNIQKTKIMASGPTTSWEIDGETVETVSDFIFGGSKITTDGDCSHEIKTLTPWKESCDQPRHHVKNQWHYFANKGSSSQGYGFSCGHVWMWELDCEEDWEPKNWCFWTVVLEKTLESPLDCKEIQPVHSEGDQPWDFFGRNDAKAETPVLWQPHAKSWLIGKDSDAGRDWGQEEKGTTEDEMAGWHRWLDGHWVWVNSGSWWWTGRPGVLRFMGSQRVGHDWATELIWSEVSLTCCGERRVTKW